MKLRSSAKLQNCTALIVVCLLPVYSAAIANGKTDPNGLTPIGTGYRGAAYIDAVNGNRTIFATILLTTLGGI